MGVSSTSSGSSPYPPVTRERKPGAIREYRKEHFSKHPQENPETQQHSLVSVELPNSVPALKPTSPSETTRVILREPVGGIAPLLFQVPGDGECTGEEAMEVVRQLRKVAQGQRRNGARVLCLSGGGPARGWQSWRCCDRLRRCCKRMLKLSPASSHYIVATSTGAIIALAMVYGRFLFLIV